MAVARRTTRKRTTRPTAAQQEQKFQRQSDLSTLQRADEIRRDRSRMSGAKREATEQRRALDRIAKK